jgi:hypothetical protein
MIVWPVPLNHTTIVYQHHYPHTAPLLKVRTKTISLPNMYHQEALTYPHLEVAINPCLPVLGRLPEVPVDMGETPHYPLLKKVYIVEEEEGVGMGRCPLY